MSRITRVATFAAALIASGSAFGQTAADELARERDALAKEQELIEQRRVEVEVRRVQAGPESADIEAEMREAERRLEEAASRIAELSSRQLPAMAGSWSMGMAGRPVLGITIGASSDEGPVEGVAILAVSPGGAAVEAGLSAGDVITAINKESLGAANSREANEKLLDFMAGVKEGDVLDLEYLRDGKSASVQVKPRQLAGQVFAFGGPEGHFRFDLPPHSPPGPGLPGKDFNRFVFLSGGGGWGDMEMVSLTKDLGRYFGTDEGMLVVRAPSDAALQLKDGDVLRSIGGRKPQSVSHAIRILGSYQPGETVEIEIMRDKKRQTLTIEMPDNRRGGISDLVLPGMGPDTMIPPEPAPPPERT
ncbi:MAG: PDZ domain-containing protein [Gammaproteobacteria bacterium]|nr:PDZ domain-containing protein [Gammaproteobacteria bacterium]MDH4252994.1 PDZ domain-containing protein [Gammaproteobacteria bacterium]MDH5308584.1 PDZ domain-containing protein [Gammaproteobacteria bacterium]